MIREEARDVKDAILLAINTCVGRRPRVLSFAKPQRGECTASLQAYLTVRGLPSIDMQYLSNRLHIR